MTNVKNLPVVNGGLGAAVGTQDQEACRTIIAAGVQGTITIEASADGVNFCPVATLTSTVLDKTVTIAAAFMRVNAQGGQATSVSVVAEAGLTRAGVIPAPPQNGPGAAFDATLFGCLTTVFVGPLTGAGTVGIEVSADGVNWSVDFKTFTGAGCDTKEISARFIRAVGQGATASVSVASEEPASSALTMPALTFVFRPGDVQGGNVYTSFADLVAAMSATQGVKILEFDDSIQPCVIPAGTWDMLEVHWIGKWPKDNSTAGVVVEIPEGCSFTNLRYLDGGIAINVTATVTPPVQDLAVGGLGDFFQWGVGGLQAFPVDLRCTGGAPFFQVQTGAVATILCEHGNIGNAFGLGNSPFPCIDLVGTADLTVITRAFGALVTNMVTGTGTLRLTRQILNALGRQSLFGGTQIYLQVTTGRATRPFVNTFTAPVPAVAPTTVAHGETVLCNVAGGGFTQLLPAIATNTLYTSGWQCIVRETSGTPGLLVDGAGADTINGGAAAVPVPAGGALVFESDGISNWNVVAEFTAGDVNRAFFLSSDISPPVLAAGATQNYAPAGLATASALRLTGDGGGTSALGGLTGGRNGRIIVVQNIGGGVITINDADAGSAAANQFALAANIAIPIDGAATFRYDGTSLVWRCIGQAI